MSSYLIGTRIANAYLKNISNRNRIYSERELAEKTALYQYMLMCVELFFPYNEMFIDNYKSDGYTLKEIVDRPITLSTSQIIESLIKEYKHFERSYIDDSGMLIVVYDHDIDKKE